MQIEDAALAVWFGSICNDSYIMFHDIFVAC